MERLLSWLRKHRKHEPAVIVADISRIARSVEAAIKLRGAIGAVGARLESPSIEFGDDAYQKTFELVAAPFAQHHCDKNAEQVRHRMRHVSRPGISVSGRPGATNTSRAMAAARCWNARCPSPA
ncbi:recombinase family protein [Salipiger sp. P9]|nr:recombinase family protein [Salipiger pentaromativorans]